MFLVRKLKALSGMKPADAILVPLIFIMLGIARLVVLTFPFRFYVGVFGRPVPLDSLPEDIETGEAFCANRIGWLVRSVARKTPWESLCLPQSMIATILLRIYSVPHMSYFGLAKTDFSMNTISAHSWVLVHGIAITGGDGHSRHVVVAAYTNSKLVG